MKFPSVEIGHNKFGLLEKQLFESMGIIFNSFRCFLLIYKFSYVIESRIKIGKVKILLKKIFKSGKGLNVLRIIVESCD